MSNLIRSSGTPVCVLVLFCFAFPGCVRSGENRAKPARTQEQPTPEQIARENSYNDTARLLAGLPLRGSSPLLPLTKSRSYTAHARFMERFWKKVEHENIVPMHAWKMKWIEDRSPSNTAIYPLSGADFVNLHSFYPDARSYIMFALEKAGRFPEIRPDDTHRMERDLRSLRAVIHTIASVNYFYSSFMRRELRSSRLTGTAPVLLVFAARLGFRVVQWDYVGIDGRGRLRVLNAAGRIENRVPAVSGIRLRIRKKGASRRDLLYFNIAVNRGTLGPGTGAGVYFRNLGRINAMFKSAVYLMHYDRYAAARTYILEQSDVIVQDDSGIPYRFFVNERWDIQLYGGYLTPYMNINGIGKPPRQRDLSARYRAGTGILPVNFRFGYGGIRGAGYSTLMLLRRRR